MNNTHLEEIKVNYNTEEWISAFPGGITSVEVDGDRLISIKKVNGTAEKLKLFAVLLLGVLIGTLGEYMLLKDNILPEEERRELMRVKHTHTSMSREARVRLRDSGVAWDKSRKDWVWVGNGLAIQSHDKHEIKD